MFQEIHLVSVSGHCIHFAFKICQNVAGISKNIFVFSIYILLCLTKNCKPARPPSAHCTILLYRPLYEFNGKWRQARLLTQARKLTKFFANQGGKLAYD